MLMYAVECETRHFMILARELIVYFEPVGRVVWAATTPGAIWYNLFEVVTLVFVAIKVSTEASRALMVSLVMCFPIQLELQGKSYVQNSERSNAPIFALYSSYFVFSNEIIKKLGSLAGCKDTPTSIVSR